MITAQHLAALRPPSGSSSRWRYDLRVITVALFCRDVSFASVSKMRDRLGLPQATASEWAELAVFHGVVERVPSTVDGRRTHLVLTPTGERFCLDVAKRESARERDADTI